MSPSPPFPISSLRADHQHGRPPLAAYCLSALVLLCLCTPASAQSGALLRGEKKQRTTLWGEYQRADSTLEAPRRSLAEEDDGATQYYGDSGGDDVVPFTLEAEPVPADCPTLYTASFTVSVKGTQSETVGSLITTTLVPDLQLPGDASRSTLSMYDSFSLPDLQDAVLSGACGVDLASASAYRVFMFKFATRELEAIKSLADYVTERLARDLVQRARLCGAVVDILRVEKNEACSADGSVRAINHLGAPRDEDTSLSAFHTEWTAAAETAVHDDEAVVETTWTVPGEEDTSGSRRPRATWVQNTGGRRRGSGNWQRGGYYGNGYGSGNQYNTHGGKKDDDDDDDHRDSSESSERKNRHSSSSEKSDGSSNSSSERKEKKKNRHRRSSSDEGSSEDNHYQQYPRGSPPPSYYYSPPSYKNHYYNSPPTNRHQPSYSGGGYYNSNTRWQPAYAPSPPTYYGNNQYDNRNQHSSTYNSGGNNGWSWYWGRGAYNG
mmetsp:Transcript_21483/g.56042  ORF Transcript_21483/g.56042 Transcript_21483/m.56042 type:complete len:493 (+) Transcript_21483:185-1663(+)